MAGDRWQVGAERELVAEHVGVRRMLSVQVNIRAVSPPRFVRPLPDGCCARGVGSGVEGRVPGDAQRVPFAANPATPAMFCLVTKAGPVSTGAAPPPLKLPLDLYSQIESTAR